MQKRFQTVIKTHLERSVIAKVSLKHPNRERVLRAAQK